MARTIKIAGIRAKTDFWMRRLQDRGLTTENRRLVDTRLCGAYDGIRPAQAGIMIRHNTTNYGAKRPEIEDNGIDDADSIHDEIAVGEFVAEQGNMANDDPRRD
ncbi:hypothetical protein C8J56DRAFT_888086 [Mycena floridula]|nr:hypothetical protein C8J56DRAFT_888086 [Mycena floridula]